MTRNRIISYLVFIILITSQVVTATNLGDCLWSFEDFASEKVAESYCRDGASPDEITELRDWAPIIVHFAFGQTPWDEISQHRIPPLVQQIFATKSESYHDARFDINKDGSLTISANTDEPRLPQSDIFRILRLIDILYSTVIEIPPFSDSETFHQFYPPTLITQAVLSPVIKATIFTDSFISHSFHPPSSHSGEIREEENREDRITPTFWEYIFPSPCRTSNETYIRAADHAIYYNTLAAGLLSATFPSVKHPSTISSPSPIHILALLSVQIHMLQQIALVMNLDLYNDAVKVMIYSALVADSVSSSFVRTAWTIAGKTVANRELEPLLRNASKKVALKLVSKWGGDKNKFRQVCSTIPILGNIIEFIGESWSTWGVGKMGKSILCPRFESTKST